MTPGRDTRAKVPSAPGLPGRRASLSPFHRDIRYGILALAVPAIVLLGALVFAITLSPGFRALDRTVSSSLRASAGDTWLVEAAEVVTWLGSWQGITLVATIAVIALLAVGRWRGAVFVLVTLIPGWLMGVALKALIDRTRPLGSLIPLPHDASFPSGHSLASFLLYGSLAVLAIAWVRRAWVRYLLVALAVAVGIAIGLSRVVLGVHFFADVLGSWLLGVAWLSITSAFYLALVGPRSRDS